MADLWRKLLGRSGERAAARYLKRRGHRVLVRNYRCVAGEIDLVTLDGETVVFVEVRTRVGEQHGSPEETVNLAKQRQVKRVARFYVRQTGCEYRACRFDVVAVVSPRGGRREIRHHAGAFE